MGAPTSPLSGRVLFPSPVSTQSTLGRRPTLLLSSTRPCTWAGLLTLTSPPRGTRMAFLLLRVAQLLVAWPPRVTLAPALTTWTATSTLVSKVLLRRPVQ